MSPTSTLLNICAVNVVNTVLQRVVKSYQEIMKLRFSVMQFSCKHLVMCVSMLLPLRRKISMKLHQHGNKYMDTRLAQMWANNNQIFKCLSIFLHPI